jgi:outer membrane protein, multidrug efflux system
VGGVHENTVAPRGASLPAALRFRDLSNGLLPKDLFVTCASCALAARSNAPAVRLGAAAALALALASCTLGPAYHRPSTPPPAAWRTTLEQAPPTWPSAQWWRGFGSPQLDQLMVEAQHANDDLAAAIAQVREAEAQVTVATAPLLPTIDAGMNAARQRQFIPQPGIGSLTYNDFNPQLSASYELTFWGNWAAHSAAVATAAASRYDRETVELTVMTNVANDYFTVLELNDLLKIQQNNLASAEQTLKGLQIDESVGTTTSLDVAQQAAEVATLSASIPPLQEQLRQTIDALAILIGKTPQDFDLPPGALADISQPQLVAGLPSELLARRPDVAQAEAQLVAANANIQQARAAFFPTIDLTANGGYESTALKTLLEPGSRVFDIAAGLTQPIFHGGAILGQYRYSKARYAELLADYHKAVISAFGNVEDSLVAVRETSDQLGRQQKAVDTAERAYQLSQTQFHAGTINILTVLSTETALFTAESTLAQVKLAHLQALVGLFNALGGGWQR